MGSQVRRHKLTWRGSPIAHAFITKDGILSARSLCNLPPEELHGTSKDHCSNCEQIISHRVLTQWVNPKKR